MIATTADTIARIGCLPGQHFPLPNQLGTSSRDANLPLEGERHSRYVACLLLPLLAYILLCFVLPVLITQPAYSAWHCSYYYQKSCIYVSWLAPTRPSYIQPFGIVLDLQDTVKSRRKPAARLDLKEEY